MLYLMFQLSGDPTGVPPEHTFFTERSSGSASARKSLGLAIPYFPTGTVHTFSTIYIIFNKINKEEARFYAAFQALVSVLVTPKKPERSTRDTLEHRILSSESVPAILPRPEQRLPSSRI
jgi:hypothetical protein